MLMIIEAMAIPIISVVGKKRVGKTTLIERLIPALEAKGVRVGTVKRDAHSFEFDHPGKDTYRHFAAGSRMTAIISGEKLALQKRLDAEATLDEVVERYFDGVDLVITEGYKSGSKPKVEVFRREAHAEMLCGPDDNLLAVASDDEVAADCPRFALDDADGLADFIITRIVKP